VWGGRLEGRVCARRFRRHHCRIVFVALREGDRVRVVDKTLFNFENPFIGACYLVLELSCRNLTGHGAIAYCQLTQTVIAPRGYHITLPMPLALYR
jgi:hypothetical protein